MKVKTIFFVVGLISLIILGFLVSVPDFIPSLKFVQAIVIVVIYVLIIGLAYIIIMLMRNYLHEKYTLHSELFSRIFAFIFITCLFIAFIIVSVNIGQGINERILVKELNFPSHGVTIYVYDNNDRTPVTSVKVKDKTFPLMHNIGFIENHRTSDLKIWRHNDTVFFYGTGIELFYDLKNRKAKKIYKKAI